MITGSSRTPGIRRGRVVIFLVLTFGLSWGFNLLIALTVGQKALLAAGLTPLDMFFPAFSALILQLFLFRDTPIHIRDYQGKPRWILYSFLMLTVLYAVITL
jgi:hypothetical protein